MDAFRCIPTLGPLGHGPNCRTVLKIAPIDRCWTMSSQHDCPLSGKCVGSILQHVSIEEQMNLQRVYMHSYACYKQRSSRFDYPYLQMRRYGDLSLGGVYLVIIWFVFTAAKSPTEVIWIPWNVSPNANLPTSFFPQSVRHMRAEKLWIISIWECEKAVSD